MAGLYEGMLQIYEHYGQYYWIVQIGWIVWMDGWMIWMDDYLPESKFKQISYILLPAG